MEEKNIFNQKVTNICKGVAILIMLIHHLFPGMDGFGLKISNIWVLPKIAILGKVCVSIFLFLSGYGLYEKYSKKLSALEFYKRRFLKLYVPYWMVFVIFIGIGFLFFRDYLNNIIATPFSVKKNLLINFLGIQYFFNGYAGINPSWWFFSQILLIYLIYPLLHKISCIKKFGSAVLCALCLVFSFFVQEIRVSGLYFNLMWFTPFIVGMLFSRHSLFAKSNNEPILQSRYCDIICLAGILFLSVLRIRAGEHTKTGLFFDFILAPLICFFLFRMYGRRNKTTEKLFAILAYLGIHSGNIYYIHLFVTNMYTTPYIYGLNSPFFMILATIAICLPFSIIIEKSKKLLFSHSFLPLNFLKKPQAAQSSIDFSRRQFCFVRWIFTIILSTFVYYSLRPILPSIIALNVVFYILFIAIGYMLYPPIAKMVYLDIPEETAAKRSSGLDLLRVIAVILVMLIHYIGSIGYYSWNAEGVVYFLVSFLRWFASVCCPLFMLLTGYFAINKKVERKSWSAVPSFLFSYFVLCIVFICYLWHINGSVDLTYIKQLVNLNAFWYVNMHFGLLLVIPFCNLAWNHLSCYRKQLLILALFVLSSFGTIANDYFTQYWYGLYPLLYYFIGGFIRQYNIKAKRSFAIISILFILTLQTIYTYSVAEGSTFNWIVNYGGYSSCYNAAPTVIVASMLLIIFKNITIKNKYVNYVLLQISKNSLIIYLASCMFVTSFVRANILPLLKIRSLPVVFFAEAIISIIICLPIGFIISTVFTRLSNTIQKKRAVLVKK